jgi:hypothetical protein
LLLSLHEHATIAACSTRASVETMSLEAAAFKAMSVQAMSVEAAVVNAPGIDMSALGRNMPTSVDGGRLRESAESQQRSAYDNLDHLDSP